MSVAIHTEPVALAAVAVIAVVLVALRRRR